MHYHFSFHSSAKADVCVHRTVTKLIYSEINFPKFLNLQRNFDEFVESLGIVNPNIDWNIVRNQNGGRKQ